MVGVVLNGDQVVDPSFALHGQIEGVSRWCALRFEKTSELEVVAKIWHFRPAPFRRRRTIRCR